MTTAQCGRGTACPIAINRDAPALLWEQSGRIGVKSPTFEKSYVTLARVPDVRMRAFC
jgi:hypothetical protein